MRGAGGRDRAGGVRLALRAAALLAAAVVLGVLASHEFPGLFGGPRTSTEVLAEIFRAPFEAMAEPARLLAERAPRQAVLLFLRALDLPEGTRGRLSEHVRSGRFEERSLPFLLYLHQLYGARSGDGDAALDLDYPGDEADTSAPAPAPAPARGSTSLRRQVEVALRLYDALFLRQRPGADERTPLRDRYDEAAYADVKAILREAAGDRAGAGLSEEEYRQTLEALLADEARLDELVRFATDLVRQLADRWREAFLRLEQRRDRRSEWVRSRLEANRHDQVADWAAARAGRRMAVHVVVDGLQGLLLEGLARLSQGDRPGRAARYVADLVEARRGAGPPGELGAHLERLAAEAPVLPGYLETFRRLAFGPGARAVTVHVATVDTPTISLRNLPVVQSGHRVAGPFGTGIPNFSYVDRRTRSPYYFWGSDVLYMGEVFANREERIPGGARRTEGPGALTLFQRLWRHSTVSCMATLDEGALEKVSSELGLAAGELRRGFMERGMVLAFRRRAAMERDLDRRRAWLAGRRLLSGGLVGSLLTRPGELARFREHAEYLAAHEDEGLPDYLLWYDPWPDHFAHGAGPWSDAILGPRGELDRLDFYLGRLVEAYGSVPGALDRTLFGLVSDHGLVHAERRVSLDDVLFGGMEADGLRPRHRKLTHDEGGLPALRDRSSLPSLEGLDAAVGSTAGGCYVIDLFDQGAAGAHGRDHPDYHRSRHHRLASGQEVDWIAELARRLGDTMDLALVREYGPAPDQAWPGGVESVVRLVTPDRGEARVWRLRPGSGPPRYRYEPLGGQDPLDLAGSVREWLIAPGGPSVDEARRRLAECMADPAGREDREWREALSSTLHPDVVYQYSHLYDSDRAGTINVFAAEGVGFQSTVPGRHAGEAFEEKNGTQLYWGAGLEAARLQTARNGSLPATLYRWLAGEEAFHAHDPERGASPAEEMGHEDLLDLEAFAPLR